MSLGQFVMRTRIFCKQESLGLQVVVFLMTASMLLLGEPKSIANSYSTCRDPQSIPDVVACRNETVNIGTPEEHRISAVLVAMAPKASIACTISRASAQPASPELGDLRCFQVFESGLIVSFNLVEGQNGDRLEVSQPVEGGNRDIVVLGNIRMRAANSDDIEEDVLTLNEVLADAFRPIEPRSRVTCAFCHRPANHPVVNINGISTKPLAGIRLNETVRGTVPKNGQIKPEELLDRLTKLRSFHSCDAGHLKSETCRRIAALESSERYFKMDGPP